MDLNMCSRRNVRGNETCFYASVRSFEIISTS